MCEIINVGNEESYAEICSYNTYEPYQRGDASTAQGPVMSEHEDAVGSHQAKDGSRCSYADLLRRKIEAGNDADNTGHQVDEQEAQVSNQSLQEDAQDEEVEHVQGNVQQVNVQEDGRHEAPVLPGQDQRVVFCTVADEDRGKSIVLLDVNGVGQNICDDIAQIVCSRCQRYLVGGIAPGGNSTNGKNPGDP